MVLKKRKKSFWIISVAVFILVITLGSVIFGVFAGNKTKNNVIEITSADFSVGSIVDGVYTKSTNSIYTKEYIECQGLTIEPDFDVLGSYKVHYYDNDLRYLGSSGTLKATNGIYKKGNSFILARYCRISITPLRMNSGVEEEVSEIRFFEVNKYARRYDITVDKKQNYTWKNVFVENADMRGYKYRSSFTDIYESRYAINSEKIKVDGFKSVYISIKGYNESDAYSYVQFFNINGSLVSNGNVKIEKTLLNNEGNRRYLEIDIPSTAEYMIVQGVRGDNYVVDYDVFLLK